MEQVEGILFSFNWLTDQNRPALRHTSLYDAHIIYAITDRNTQICSVVDVSRDNFARGQFLYHSLLWWQSSEWIANLPNGGN
jgi:hypothetical protein